LAAAVAAGVMVRGSVTQLGEVLIGRAEGRSSPEEITLFDSTGLAIQDLGLAIAVYEAWQRGEVEGRPVTL
jgi:ornithine cyclodeaminase/alanine dehydrogenase-like protein (mu-crystallin family)